MNRAVVAFLIIFVLVAAVVVSLRDRAADAGRVYSQYDRNFRKYLGKATHVVGKETIKVEPLSDQFTVPKKLSIKGTPYDIGLTIGVIAKQAGSRLPLVTDSTRAANQKVVELYRRIYPQDLELARGVAAAFDKPAAEIDMRLLDAKFIAPLWVRLLNHRQFYIATDFGEFGDPKPNQHCSSASYFANGHQLVGSHFDHASDRPTFFTTVQMIGVYKIVGNTVYDLTGELVDGMNEKGLSLCVASNDYGKYSIREPYPDEPAVVMWHMMQIVMQTCATVDEALALLRTVRVWFPEEGNHWLIADASGKSVVVEWTPGEHKMVVFDKPGPYELLTNTTFQEGENYLVENCPRYRKAKPLFENGVQGTTDMLNVMNSMRITHGPGRSLWTTIMDLNARTIEVRYFKEYDRKYEFHF